MKKHLFLVAALAASMSINAQYTQELPLTYEDFFRVEAINAHGDSLELGAYTGTSGVSIMADQWSNGGKSGENVGKNPVLQASSLKYDAYVDNLKGSEILLANLASGTRASIYSLKNDYTYSGNAYYLAALINITEATGKGDILSFDGNFAANAQRGRLFVNKNGSGYMLGLGWNEDPTTWTGELEFGSTHLVIMKVIPAGKTSTGTEEAAIWVDPDLDKVEAQNTPLATLTGQTIGLKSVRGITIRQRQKIAGSIAGLRFGASWADVVKKSAASLPALDVPVVGAASAIHAEDFTANWTAVENAAGYIVNVYAGEDKIATKTVGEVTSVVVNNMPPTTTLTYTVTALGDKENYDDSEESGKSVAFTTAVALANIITDFSDTDTWGEAAASTAEALSDQTVNGFEFVKAGLQTGGMNYEATGERFENRISIDKVANGGMVTLPAVATCAQIDIYASAGTENKDLKLQVYNYTTKVWADVETYQCAIKANCYRFTAVLDKSESTKLRVANADNSTKYVWKIVTFASAPTTLNAPVVADATDVTATGFTANWAAVANASGYRVLITSADTTIRATLADDVLNLAVDLLKPTTEYTVKVAAIGDDAAFVGSVLSEGKVITTSASDPTAIDEVNVKAKAEKVIIDGQLFIRKNGELFNLTGARVE